MKSKRKIISVIVMLAIYGAVIAFLIYALPNWTPMSVLTHFPILVLGLIVAFVVDHFVLKKELGKVVWITEFLLMVLIDLIFKSHGR